ncbi:unnamed protein product [Porites evermanni]|uniref:Uncharacterized protein n=1 Tax=Porites evermanni TaxID=104178 RepID=A0ABN8LWX7_9CNID|nr:unnamed protein product [Porites evermanni]
MAPSGNGAARDSDVTSLGTGQELNFDDVTLKDQTIMAQSGNRAASEIDFTSHGTEQELNFDDDTLKGKDSYNSSGPLKFWKAVSYQTIMALSGNGSACDRDVTTLGAGQELNRDDDTLKDQTIMAPSGNGAACDGDVTSLGTGQELNFDDDTLKDQTIMAQSGNGAASEGDVTSLGTGQELNFDDDTLKDQTIMAPSGNGAACDSDVTSLGTGQELNFDDVTLKATAEVYKTEGNEAYLKEDYSNAVYFYTEGIKVNCLEEDRKAKLYSNRAYANLRLANYIYSLVDVKNATNIRPLAIKLIIAGAKAFAKLKLFELAITWCDQGLAVSFYSLYSSIAEKWFIFATC